MVAPKLWSARVFQTHIVHFWLAMHKRIYATTYIAIIVRMYIGHIWSLPAQGKIYDRIIIRGEWIY